MVRSPLEPHVLDDLLARGEFRFGGTMRTTRFTVWEERHLRSTIWTRTDIDQLTWSKSNRRLLNRLRRFEVQHHPMDLSEEHDALYRRYCAHVGGDRPSTLVDFLGGEEAVEAYDTEQISIRSNGELAAFGLFDVGENSIMSLLGAFDPSYARDSLGMGSMLLEVEHARATGRRFHYSGYVLPGEPRMDYKLRVGAMEFLHPDLKAWHPWSELAHTVLPDERTRNALDSVRRALARVSHRSRRILNPLFEIAGSDLIQERMVHEPMLVMVHAPKPPFPMVTWDDEIQIYDVWTGFPAVIRHKRSSDGPEKSTQTALINDHLGQFASAMDVRDAIIHRSA